ncbi:hypothetical protein C0Q70_07059 [Pomacea canaliculata]|uniref:Uncharacterized protein n=1 Tax=Pomacea canaliculata TaxID=400727 RepID=A0A2T7PDZ5_POMCA|nr:hypothetical protein C0Q70_07059 [Pomacea canaliculata]
MFRRVLAPDLESVCGSPFGCQACDQRRPGAAILPEDAQLARSIDGNLQNNGKEGLGNVFTPHRVYSPKGLLIACRPQSRHVVTKRSFPSPSVSTCSSTSSSPRSSGLTVPRLEVSGWHQISRPTGNDDCVKPAARTLDVARPLTPRLTFPSGRDDESDSWRVPSANRQRAPSACHAQSSLHEHFTRNSNRGCARM